MWTEFQFKGIRSLSLFVTHKALVDHKLPLVSTGFGTYVDNRKATFMPAFGEVFGYTPSPHTDAQYPNNWLFEIGAKSDSTFLLVRPVETVKDQSLWMGSLQEYSESNVTVTAAGFVDGQPVALEGVGYCEGVGFETPSEYDARAMRFLQTGKG